ncbi:hypothetical protein GCM10022224_040120 [Nonomuraea antimicrobica]|uniref:Response regulatory domain-containing protein n=1 Tax=Nonomuraea antimicrobica TaxID=561173 RepID=A0ABP7BWL8_9ACTN
MGGNTLEAPVTVSIVDDHPVTIEGILTWLRAEPRIQVITTGATIESLGPSAIPRARVLLLDLNLDGRLAIPHVAELADAGHRIIVYSQFTEQKLIMAALDAGAREFVAKREGRTHLVNAILAVAADHPYVTPTEAGVLAEDHRENRPVLSDRERTALLLWFRSTSKAAVARRMAVSPHTVDMFIRRARLKYAQVGRSAVTKSDLLARAIEDGLISPEELAS